MRESLLDRLVCPDTLAPLRPRVIEAERDNALEGELTCDSGQYYRIHRGIPGFVADAVLQSQTARSFAQKWSRHQYYREHTGRFYTDWYLCRYGFGTLEGLRSFLAGKEWVLDAGTGMGRDAANLAQCSAATVFAVDLSREALEAAAERITDPRIAFVHADINRLPFANDSFDFINCDQVIHHTPNPRAAFEHLRRKLRPGGQICCYVYKKKAAIREFADDHVRARLSGLGIDEALQACEAITRLGRTLAKLNITINVEEAIPALGIEQGEIDLQRFFHWNVMKCFWNEEFDFFTNNIINFDWYHPENCFRFEPGEFRDWFATGWDIDAWDVQDAGISCRATKV